MDDFRYVGTKEECEKLKSAMLNMLGEILK